MIKGLYGFAEKWSECGNVWIVSDTHFLDSDRELMGYKINSGEHQRLINSKIGKYDTLIHLGDVGDIEMMSGIRGYKVLILGNHDFTATKYKDVFNEVYEGPLFISRKILLSHEPIYGLPFAFNIHGHDHNPKNSGDEFHLNLAANVCEYLPVSLNDIIKSGITKEIKDIHRTTIDNAINLKYY
jgi:calcineurin-like phosphoesterase family protein